MSVIVNKKTMKFEFLVVRALFVPLIFGMDFQKEHVGTFPGYLPWDRVGPLEPWFSVVHQENVGGQGPESIFKQGQPCTPRSVSPVPVQGRDLGSPAPTSGVYQVRFKWKVFIVREASYDG